MYKANGQLSVAGEKWMTLVKGCNLPEDYDGDINEVVSESEPNCQSTKQNERLPLRRIGVPSCLKMELMVKCLS